DHHLQLRAQSLSRLRRDHRGVRARVSAIRHHGVPRPESGVLASQPIHWLAGGKAYRFWLGFGLSEREGKAFGKKPCSETSDCGTSANEKPKLRRKDTPCIGDVRLRP